MDSRMYPVPPEEIGTTYSRLVPLPNHPVTTEMVDRGLTLKRSFEISERMAETWLAALITKIKE